MAVDFSAHMFKQMNQDLSFDKRDPNHYWEAMNMELVNNGQTLSLVSTSGTEELLEIKTVYETYIDTVDSESFTLTYVGKVYNFDYRIDNPGDQTHKDFDIIGLVALREDLYIFTQTNHNLNIIFRYTGTSFTGEPLEIVYAGYMEMTKNNPLEIHANYENEDVQKLYWVDGVNWVRTINVAPSNADTLETMPIEFVDIAVPVDMDTPEVISESSGGSHKAGRIQYAYTLYNRSGQQTTLSPFSAIYSLSNIDESGGAPNENINIAITVEIENLDPSYDSIRVYSIHYNQDGETQDVILVLDEGVSDTKFTFVDDGNLFVSNSTINELIALSNARYRGGTLNVKKNRMFLADYSVDNFDIGDFDTRAYSYNSVLINPVAPISNVDASEPLVVGIDYSIVPEEHDAKNINLSIYKYIYGISSTTYGGTGLYVEYEHTNVAHNDKTQTFLKQGEKYRIGIMFRDQYGRTSPVKWVADTVVPYNTPSGLGSSIKVTMNSDGIIEAKSRGAVGYSVLMVNRNYEDRDILAQGFVTPTFLLTDFAGVPLTTKYRPYYITKDITTELGGAIDRDYYNGEDFCSGDAGDTDGERRKLEKHDEYCYMYSPDIDFKVSADINANYVNIVGTADMTSAESDYVLYRSGSYQFGKNHDILIFSNAIPGGGTEIWSGGGTNEPTNYMGCESNQGDSYEVFFKKFYSPVDYKEGETITLKEPSFVIETNDEKIIDTVNVTANSIKLTSFTGNDTASDTHKHSYTVGQDSVALAFDAHTWHRDDPTEVAGAPYDKFKAVATPARSIPVIDLKRGIVNQYGGDSFETRRRNTYIEISDFSIFPVASVPDSITTNTGDTFIGEHILTRMSAENKVNGETWHTWEYIIITLESYIDTERRYDNSKIILEGDTSPPELRPVLLNDWYAYNTAYSELPDAFTYIPKPYNFQEQIVFDSNIIASDVKFNNEVIDSWTNFLPNETMQLNSKYGKIEKLQEFKGELYAFQPRAIASLSILPRVQVQASDGVNLELGTGAVLQDYDYVTTVSGSANKWSILSVHDEVFYYDYYNKSISSMQEGSISIKYNLQKLVTDTHINNGINLQNDNPLLGQGVLTTYDTNKKNVYFSFLGTDNKTLSFNLLTRGFVSLHSFSPKVWVELDGKYISTEKVNKLYQHIYEFNNDTNRTLYDNNINSYITILSSKEALFNKIFGNVELDVTGTPIFNAIEAWNDYQTTGEVDLIYKQNIRQSYRKWRIALPREENSRNILSDTKLWVKLLHNHDAANPIDNLVLNNVEIKYTK